MVRMGPTGRYACRDGSGPVTVLEDTITYLEMLERPVGRRIIDDASVAAQIHQSAIEIFVLYVRGVPAGFFELDTAAARETKLCYFGLIPDFIGRRLGPYLLQAAIDRAWSRPIDRFWLHTSTFDHPKALRVYQQAGFVVYARRTVLFDDPRERGILPRTLGHRMRLPTG